MSTFTVCICVRNGQLYIDDCLSALSRELLGLDCEVVIINHLSVDRTAGLLQEHLSRFSVPMKIFNFAVPGLAAARNFAWSQVKTQWLVFLDIDCIVQSGWGRGVSEGLEYFDSKTEVGAFAGKNLVPHSERILFQGYRLLMSTYIGGHSSILNRPFSSAFEVEHGPTLNIAFRKSAMEGISGFDESFTRVAEDLDLSFRLRRSGFQMWTWPSMVVHHHLKPNLKTWLKNMHLYGRGRIFFIKRHPRAFEAKFLLPILVAGGYAAALTLSIVSLNFIVVVAYSLAHLFCISVILSFSSEKKTFKSFIFAVFLIALTHFCFGMGAIRQCLVSTKKF